MIYILIFLFFIATPAFAQLSPPMTGQMATQPLVYYRVGFVSRGKQLSRTEGNQLLDSLKNEPITEKYILRLKQSPDKTYEVEMLMKIIFFDKHEADLALEFLQENPMFCKTSFDLEVVECRE